jgi:hypothetical protein
MNYQAVSLADPPDLLEPMLELHAVGRSGLARFVAPVRPTGKSGYRWRRWSATSPGRALTGRLSTPGCAPLAARGRMLRVCPASTVVEADVGTWESWTGMRFPDSGPSARLFDRVAAAGRHDARRALAGVRQRRRLHRPWQPPRPGWRLAVLGGAAVLAPGVQMIEWVQGRPIEVPVVAAGSIVMFLLIVARTQRLTREVTVQDERRRLLGRVPGDALMGELQGADEVLEGVEKGLGEETRPPVLDNRGLAEALDEHVQRFEQEHRVAVDAR